MCLCVCACLSACGYTSNGNMKGSSSDSQVSLCKLQGALLLTVQVPCVQNVCKLLAVVIPPMGIEVSWKPCTDSQCHFSPHMHSNAVGGYLYNFCLQTGLRTRSCILCNPNLQMEMLEVHTNNTVNAHKENKYHKSFLSGFQLTLQIDYPNYTIPTINLPYITL